MPPRIATPRTAAPMSGNSRARWRMLYRGKRRRGSTSSTMASSASPAGLIYSLERLSGFEPRPDKLYPAVWLGRDRIRFADFMAAEFPRGTVGSPGHACVGPIAYQGHASVRRDIDNLRSAATAAEVEEVFFTAVAPASVGYDAVNEYYSNERDYVFAIAKALREEYLEVHKAGFVLQVDDAVLANMYDEPAALSRVGGVAYRGAQSCGGGHTRGSRPLSRLLRQLARAPCRRRSARGHRRSDS